MRFDVVLPISLFVVVILTIFVYQKLENKIKSLFEETKLGKREVVLFVSIMGVMITVIAFMPGLAIQILYLSNLSYLLFSFSYLILKKWYVCIFPPLVFILFYFLYWDKFVFNIFALILACIITLYLNTIFSWKTISIFAVLITALDVFQVFGTGFMGQATEKVLELKLPVLIVLPTYPIAGFILLGLGDILFSGLLSLQMALKLGYKSGILTAMMISIAMFFYEIVAYNTEYFTYFPATVVIILGWLAGIGVTRVVCGQTFSFLKK